jgi:hypothetical protein
MNARAAFSCIVEPRAGDVVLVSQSANDFHVLSVLDRPEQQDMTLRFPSDVSLVASAGQMDLVSGDKINVVSATGAHMASDELTFTAGRMRVSTDELTSHANHINNHSQSISLYTNILDTVARQVSQKTETLVRWVEGVETLSIGNLIQKVRNNLTSHSSQAVITAKNDMRIDAERIHMG